MTAHTPTTSRIIDGREGRAGAPAERIRELKCQAREARTSAGDIVGMLYFAFFSVVISIYVVWTLALV